MGLLTDALRFIAPEQKIALGASVPTWQQGSPQYAQMAMPYIRAAREAYGSNEIIFACIEELCTSAAEPRLAAYSGQGKHKKEVEHHPVLQIFERPNPFMSRFAFIASIILHRSLAGNAYIEKVRSKAGAVVEFWLLRPDRMKVIPDAQRFIRGYRYELGEIKTDIDVRNVIHSRTRNPADDYYGLPPLAACAARADTDNLMRAFTAAFFRNAGVPSGLLTIQRAINDSDRNMLRTRFRGETGGANAHSLLVVDGMEASYTAMGLPLGERGLVMPDLDEIDEARLCMPFGVPLELVGARLGMIHGNRSTTKEARAGFWDETLAPLYADLAADLTNGLVDDFDGFEYLEFDTSTVKALQEDQDAKHARIREDMLAGILTQQEARQELGYDPDPPPEGYWMLKPGISATAVGDEIAEPAPVVDPNAAPATEDQPAPGKPPIPLTATDIRRAKALMVALGGGELEAAMVGNGRH